MDCLIDKRGNVFRPGSAELRLAYGAPISSASLPDFLVRNTGLIELKITKDAVAIRVAPSRVELAGYSKALQLVTAHAACRASLSWFDGQWHFEIFRNAHAAMQRLMALMLSGELTDQKQFLSFGRCIDSLGRNDPLAAIVGMWQSHSGQLHIDTAREVLNEKVDAKYSVVSRDATNGTLRFVEFGPGLLIYSGRGSMSVCLGRAVQDQPDYRYGRWIAEGYRDAVLANEPLVTDMDVIVGDPLTDEQRRLQYRRLTLPVVTSDGSTALLSAVCVDPRIDLSLEVHHEVE